MKGILNHVVGGLVTFVVAILFVLLIKGMLIFKPPFLVAPHGTAAADSTAAEDAEKLVTGPPGAPEPPAHEKSTAEAQRPAAVGGDATAPARVEGHPAGARPAPVAAAVFPTPATAGGDSSLGGHAPLDLAPPLPSETQRLQRLVRVYEKMRPKQVALILNTMPDRQSVAILATMNERSAAKVIAGMEPEKAARMSQMLVQAGQP